MLQCELLGALLPQLLTKLPLAGREGTAAFMGLADAFLEAYFLLLPSLRLGRGHKRSCAEFHARRRQVGFHPGQIPRSRSGAGLGIDDSAMALLRFGLEISFPVLALATFHVQRPRRPIGRVARLGHELLSDGDASLQRITLGLKILHPLPVLFRLTSQRGLRRAKRGRLFEALLRLARKDRVLLRENTELRGRRRNLLT
mmetsp:Transcript_3920/g.10021  ORF Transcript_3920/g.10021 Transcript_3920/m.10021 type:complete len:200 (+) Transcript_3920:1186-1785(+)